MSSAIIINTLRPGDIILTGGKKGQSKLIQRATGGDYSHAAIMLTSTVLCEAVGDGLGFKAINIVGVLRDGDRATLFGRIPHASNILCLRHKKTVQTDYFIESLLFSMLPFWGLEYPKLEALLDAVEQLRDYPDLFNRAQKIIGRFQKHIEYPGPFCSQLVSEIYANLGIHIFPGKQHSYVAPADFLTSNALESVNCLASIPPSATTDDPLLDDFRHLSQRSWLTDDTRKLTTNIHKEFGLLVKAWKAKNRVLGEIIGDKAHGFDQINNLGTLNRRFIYSQNLPRLVMYCHLERRELRTLIPGYPESDLFTDLLDQIKSKINTNSIQE